MAKIDFRELTKIFPGGTRAVDELNLEIGDGEFMVVVGPSGSGKTTVLRIAAGLDRATHGEVWIGEELVNDVPPMDRNIAMVFQSYALYPHMTVYENMAFGLKLHGLKKKEIEPRVRSTAKMLGIDELLKRKPGQLSGGQRQRVALARALVNRPQVLLLDEPLGALDLKLRREMQIELKQLQRDVGITFVFVTHDQEEALTMSDRIAVFNDGRIEQVAAPAELYEAPASSFVAGFVGTSNLLTGETARVVLGRSGMFSIRPEKIHLSGADEAAGLRARATGVIEAVVYLGSVNHYVVRLDEGGTLTVLRQNLHGTSDQQVGTEGEKVTLAWSDEHLIDLTPTASGPHQEET